jgi:hypothetical protein
MTQYSFLITFYECELDMLQKALTHYLGLCKQGIKNGDGRLIFDSVMIKCLRSELRKKTGRSPRVSVDEGEESALEAVRRIVSGATTLATRWRRHGRAEPAMTRAALRDRIGLSKDE